MEAVYREPETADYAGNPLIEALPPVLTTEQAMLGLAYYPDYDPSRRSAPDHVRYHLIQNGLRFFAPLDIHLDLERRFSCLIRIGYTERNPLAIGFWDEVRARVEAASQYGTISAPRRNQWPSSAAGFNIVGMSGVGKSFSVERVLTRLGKLIAFCSSLACNPCSSGHHHLQDLVASPPLSEQPLCELKHSGQSFARNRVDFLADSRFFIGELKPFRFSAATSRPLN